MFRIEYLDLQITLRCNCRCANCIKFCNMPDTGLDYSDTDLTLTQVVEFIRQVRSVNAFIDNLIVTGGEPTLHQDLQSIMAMLDVALLGKHADRISINSNGTLPVLTELLPRLINFSSPKDAQQVHDAVFLHPDDLGRPRPTFAGCNHYRKWRVVWNTYGCSLCCAADGYIRLFGLDNLVLPELPSSFDGFPLSEMNAVCQHCPFGTGAPAHQRDVGRPVSAIYEEAFRRNRNE